MDSGTENTRATFWNASAKKTSRRVNFAWWLESLSTPLLIAALVSAAACLLIRREFPEIGTAETLGGIGAGIVLIGLACWAFARRKFEKPQQSLVRIEASMRLRNALSAANAGVAPWPEPVAKIDAGLGWQWQKLLVPPLGALALLAAGFLIPISKSAREVVSPEEPQAWKQLSSELDHLTKEEVIDEKYLEETRKRLDQLKAQEEEQWFSHSSLEATDSLKEAHRSESSRVERELERADKALSNLEKNGGKAGQEAKNRQMEEFDQALQGLQNGAMKPNPQLLEQMKQLNPKTAKLTPEQLQQLRENLQKHGQAMKDAKGGAGEGEDWSDELLAGEEGEQGNGPGKDGEGPGKGGVNRGPGHAPGVLGNEKDAMETGELTALEAADLSRALPGDLLQLQDGEHEIERSASRVAEGGATEATGQGGERVWRDALDPAEQNTLKRFFE